jgi:hypothetical protein
MTTQKYMGRGQLVDRLTAQVGDHDTAVAILKQRGMMDENGQLTAKGQARNAMTAEERAINRATKRSGRPASDYVYNRKTNRAVLK